MTSPRLPARSRAEVVAWVLVFRALLWAVPFRTVLGAARRAASWSARSGSPVGARDLAAVLRQATRFTPRATCLPQALGAAVFVGRRGLPVDVVLGSTPEAPRERLEAHAWIAYGAGKTVGDAGDHVEVARLRIASGS